MKDFATCPRCKSAILLYKEASEAVERWKQDENGTITEVDGGAILGRIIRIEGECLDPKCGHRWGIRKIKNITELPNWPGEANTNYTNIEPLDNSVTEEEISEELEEDDADAIEQEEPPVINKQPLPKKRSTKNKKAA